MPRLIRLDQTGHTTIAEWTSDDDAAFATAAKELERELANGMIASATMAGTAEVVRELPREAELVVLRRQIAGG